MADDRVAVLGGWIGVAHLELSDELLGAIDAAIAETGAGVDQSPANRLVPRPRVTTVTHVERSFQWPCSSYLLPRGDRWIMVSLDPGVDGWLKRVHQAARSRFFGIASVDAWLTPDPDDSDATRSASTLARSASASSPTTPSWRTCQR